MWTIVSFSHNFARKGIFLSSFYFFLCQIVAALCGRTQIKKGEIQVLWQ